MNKTLVAMALSLACVATPAYAELYAGGGIGAAYTEERNTSYKFFGGFQPTRMFGLELAYNNFGDHPGSNTDSWSLAGTGRFPLGETWDLLGKLGVTSNHRKFPVSAKRTGLLAGVGVDYNVTKDFCLRIEYENFGELFDDDAYGNSLTVTQWGMSAKYSF